MPGLWEEVLEMQTENMVPVVPGKAARERGEKAWQRITYGASGFRTSWQT